MGPLAESPKGCETEGASVVDATRGAAMPPCDQGGERDVQGSGGGDIGLPHGAAALLSVFVQCKGLIRGSFSAEQVRQFEGALSRPSTLTTADAPAATAAAKDESLGDSGECAVAPATRAVDDHGRPILGVLCCPRLYSNDAIRQAQSSPHPLLLLRVAQDDADAGSSQAALRSAYVNDAARRLVPGGIVFGSEWPAGWEERNIRSIYAGHAGRDPGTQ